MNFCGGGVVCSEVEQAEEEEESNVENTVLLRSPVEEDEVSLRGFL